MAQTNKSDRLKLDSAEKHDKYSTYYKYEEQMS